MKKNILLKKNDNERNQIIFYWKYLFNVCFLSKNIQFFTFLVKEIILQNK